MGIRELKFICTFEEEYICCRTKRLKFGVGGLIYEIAYIPELYLNALITTMNRVSTKIDNLPPLSPADYSSLPGLIMPNSENKFPTKQEVIHYLGQYEQYYQLNVKRNSEVVEIKKNGDFFAK